MPDNKFRISLNVDLDPNDVLDEKLSEMIRSRARQMAREEFEKVLREEFERKARDHFSKTHEYYWTAAMAKAIREYVESKTLITPDKVDALLPEAIQKLVENRFSRNVDGGNFDDFIKDRVGRAMSGIFAQGIQSIQE